MLLITAATTFELEPLLNRVALPSSAFATLVTGIGPVEAAARTVHFLARTRKPIATVLNIGVAGAYLRPDAGKGAELLDLCLAELEVLGDLGVCQGGKIEPLSNGPLEVIDCFKLDAALRMRAESALLGGGLSCQSGVFVTVSCVSGSRARGMELARRHGGLCENMEGAAVARACALFDLPLVELRCISNLVEDRELAPWQVKQACARLGQAASLVVQGLQHV